MTVEKLDTKIIDLISEMIADFDNPDTESGTYREFAIKLINAVRNWDAANIHDRQR